MPIKTVYELARETIPQEIGFDCALPQPWVDDMSKLGVDARGHFVWIYDEPAGLWGRPFYLGDPYPDHFAACGGAVLP